MNSLVCSSDHVEPVSAMSDLCQSGMAGACNLKGHSQLEHICWFRIGPVRDDRRMVASKVEMEREEAQSEHRLTSTECLATGWPEAGLE